jgi:hypothetical protein
MFFSVTVLIEGTHCVGDGSKVKSLGHPASRIAALAGQEMPTEGIIARRGHDQRMHPSGWYLSL